MTIKNILLTLIITSTLAHAAPILSNLDNAFKYWDKGKFSLVEQELLPLAKYKPDEKSSAIAQAYLGQLYLYDLKDYSKALKWLTKSADKGYSAAQYDLGTMYQSGDGVDVDYKKAFDYYLKSAEQDFEDAQAQLALFYGLGKGIEKNHTKAAYWHKKAAKGGVQKSMVFLGISYYSGRGIGRDIKEARYWIQRGIKGDDKELSGDAQSFLDLIAKETGALDVDNLIDKSLEQARAGDFKKAKALINELANNGNTDAQYFLSKYYRDPDGLNKPDIGEKWLHKAASNNNALAQYDIAWKYSAGWITADIEQVIKSVYWNERAGFNGDTRAYGNLASLYDKEERDVLFEMEQAANKGNAMAQYNMGWITARGLLSEDGLMQGRDVAKKWFEKSAKQNFEDAILILDRDY